MSSLLRLTAVLSVLLACNDKGPFEPLSELPFAYATNSCGPTDAPTVVIYLAAQSFQLPELVAPYIQVNVPVASSELKAGDEFEVQEDWTGANAWFHASGLEPRAANHGEVGITAFGANALSGYVDLEFAGGLQFRGSFVAAWQPRQLLLCG